MDVLILGGTAWLGRETATAFRAAGHDVTCLARGESGAAADGVRLVAADRGAPGAYDEVAGREWDCVIEVSWQPIFVREALAALADSTRHWIYVSSGNVYAETSVLGADETSSRLDPTPEDRVDRASYGPAKVACEDATLAAIGDRSLVVRSGLIGGPRDPSDRVGYWVARSARDPNAPLLVPAPDPCPVQAVDVRDLADWFVRAGTAGTVGVFDAVGPVLPFTEWVAMSRRIGGHDGPVVPVAADWLAEQNIDWFMGEESIALWLAEADWYGFSARPGTAAVAAGLDRRPYAEMLVDVLTDERVRGLDRPRQAGLSVRREQELIERWTAR
jgi:nucleoside-diphosphate-sugar epimerase